MVNLFTPKAAGTVNIAATTSSARVALAINSGTFQVRVKNLDTTNAVFINFGDSTVTAAVATAIPVGPGETCGFSISGSTHVAAITAAATATVYFTPGNGV
jgi:hypothetical protein